MPLGPGESEASAALHIPSINAVATADVVYDQVHLWLLEGRPQGWLENIRLVRSLGPRTILPGHGAPGGPELLDECQRYTEYFLELTRPGMTKDDAKARIKERYASYRLPVIAEWSVEPPEWAREEV